MKASTFLVDTHVFIYWLLEPEKLSRTAVEALKSGKHPLRVSVMTLLEIAYLAEIGRLELRWEDALDWVRGQEGWEIVPFDTLALHPAAAVRTRDPFDRVLLATVLAHGWRLLTKDAWMRAEYPKIAVW